MDRPSLKRGARFIREEHVGKVLSRQSDDSDKLSPKKLPCLICGQRAFTEGAFQSNRELKLLTCLLTLFQVKLDKKAMISSDDDKGGYPSYCMGCTEQLQLLVKLQYQLKELEVTLQDNARLIKAEMVKSEEAFRNDGVYDENGSYYNIRVKILGDEAGTKSKSGMHKDMRRMCSGTTEELIKPKQEGEGSTSPLRRSIRSNKGKASFVQDHFLENQTNPNVEDIEATDIKVEVDSLINNDNNDDAEDFDYEAYGSSDSSYSPGSVAGVLSDVEQDNDSDDESGNLLKDETKTTEKSKSNQNFKRPKPLLIVEAYDSSDYSSDGEQDDDSDNESRRYRKITEKSKSKENLKKRPKPMLITDQSNLRANKRPKQTKGKKGQKGSYSKGKISKITVDPVTGDREYLNVKFKKLADDKFRCRECLEIVINNNTIKKHTFRSHTDRYVCHICGQHKGGGSDLKKHIREVHEGISRKPMEKKLECPICGKPFGHKTHMAFHKTTHYNEEDKVEAAAKGEKLLNQKGRPQQCGVCGKVFGNVTWLKKHEKSKHPKTEEERSETQRICSECGKSVSDTYFKLHMERYHSDLDISVKMPYVCTFCEKRFFTLQRLTHHKRVHSGERPFICTICDKSFITNDRLKYHNMQNHEKSKPFPCTKCPAAFITGYKLRRHFATVHEGKNQKDWNKKK